MNIVILLSVSTKPVFVLTPDPSLHAGDAIDQYYEAKCRLARLGD